LILLSIAQDLRAGSRIALVGPLFIVCYRAFATERIQSRRGLRKIFSTLTVAAIFVASLALSQIIGSTRVGNTVSDPLSTLESFDQLGALNTLYAKFNSIGSGVQLIEGYGAGAAGFKPYIGSLLFFVPRFIYPNKPVAGSIDGSYAGIPARLVPTLFNPNDTINNVGVSPLAISIWEWGWSLGVLVFLFACVANLYLINWLVTNRMQALQLLGFYAAAFPTLIGVFPSPDTALKNATLAACIAGLLYFYRVILLSPFRQQHSTSSSTLWHEMQIARWSESTQKKAGN
jgi:hypothetical protein